MSFVVGFGSTEQDFEAAEEAAIREYVAERYAATEAAYFNDALIADVREWLTARAKVLHDEASAYKTAADHPDRYSQYWPRIVADASHLVVILSVHHINRRHAFSPDGWALLMTKPVFLIEANDLERRLPA